MPPVDKPKFQWTPIILGTLIFGVVGYALAGNVKQAIGFSIWLILFGVIYAIRWGYRKLIDLHKNRNQPAK